jgi:glycosyltransferase involved in cell wall biosynthesis
MPGRDIVIANGFDRFHLMTAAAEVARHGRLACALAGFYPSARWRTLIAGAGLDRVHRLGRLMDRAVALPDEQVRALPLIEALGHLGAGLLGERAVLAARHAYAREVAAHLPALGGRLLHYRSGFGHAAVAAARAQGMAVLCDHSIAHPAVLEHLVGHDGRLPPRGQSGKVGALWADVQTDLCGADAVLVCSDFVKDTFVHQGWDPARVHVAYLGIDDAFLQLLDELAPPPPRPDESGPLRLLFAGTVERRKGVDALAGALAGLDDMPWTLDLIGPIDAEMGRLHGAFFADPRVTLGGIVRRAELARRLAAAELFLFPSLAEGSARVVFEALACGCCVVTTPNTGSIVQDGVHGRLVAPGDVEGIRAALRAFYADRAGLAAIRARNAEGLRARWRQRHYGAALLEVYDQVLAARTGARARRAA